MSNIKYVPCSCHGEGLYLSHDKDFGGLLDIAMYKLGNISKALSWGQRFRYCWKVLTKGSPYLDQVILTPEQTTEFRDFLNEVISSNDVSKNTSYKE